MTMTMTATAPATTYFTTTAGALRDAIEAVAPAASTDQARPILTTVRVELDNGSLRLVATDSYRMHTAMLSGNAPGTYAANVRADVLVEAVRKIAPRRRAGVRVALGLDVDALELAGDRGTRRLTLADGHLVDGEFPNWRPLLPAPGEAVADWRPIGGLVAWFEAAARAAIAAHAHTVWSQLAEELTTRAGDERAFKQARERSAGRGLVTVEADGGQAVLRVKAEGADVPAIARGEAGIVSERFGEVTPIAFNVEYLSDAVEAVRAVTGPCRVEARSPLKPALVVPEGARGWADATVAALVMPVRP